MSWSTRDVGFAREKVIHEYMQLARGPFGALLPWHGHWRTKPGPDRIVSKLTTMARLRCALHVYGVGGFFSCSFSVSCAVFLAYATLGAAIFLLLASTTFLNVFLGAHAAVAV